MSSPWSCTGSGIARTCSHPEVSIGADANLQMFVYLTNSVATVRQLNCQITNQVHITKAPGGSPMNSDPQDDTATATAQVPSFCQQVPPPPSPPVQKECPPNTVGTYPDCKPVIVKPIECPRGTTGKPPVCCEPPQMYRNGQCVCPPRQHLSHGECCPLGKEWNGKECSKPGTRECRPGTIGKYPDCKPVIIRKCPEGTIGRYPLCRSIVKHCPPGTTGKYPNCKPIIRKCPEGTIGRYPLCRKIERKCPAGMAGTPPKCHPVLKRR